MEQRNFSSLLADLRGGFKTGGVAPRTHSGAVQPGDVFVVLPPASQDGKSGKGGLDFLPMALAAGAGTVVHSSSDAAAVASAIKASGAKAVAIAVKDSRIALGELASAYYGTENYRPALVGITGTNGKTTSTYLLEALFNAAGKKCGVLGTVSYRWPGFSKVAPLTTPGCLELHELFSGMHNAGVEVVFMEVSSHALDQLRIAGLNFSAALLTNVTQDHLDYHGTMDMYFAAKAKLFHPQAMGGVPQDAKARAINLDDAYGAKLMAECTPEAGTCIGYTLAGAKAEGRVLHGILAAQSPAGLLLKHEFEGKTWELHSPLVGAFNAYNLLGVQAVGLGLGLTPEDFKFLEGFTGVSGRLERIINNKGLNAFVDYAHTPDALVKAITALRDAGFKRIITVFGCGGNRDRTKRPLMGEAVAKYSDVAVLTSDNPRLEDPEAIMQDVLPGLANSKERYAIADRKAATAKAVSLLGPKDALLVAGKGHEDYQIVGTEKIYYSDQAVLLELLNA